MTFLGKRGVDMVTIRDSRKSKKCGMVMVDDDYTIKYTVENSKNAVLEEIRSWQNKRASAQNIQSSAENVRSRAKKLYGPGFFEKIST